MFKSNKSPALPPSTDFTGSLREASFYKYGHLRQLGLTGEITAVAVDPVLSLLAVGTAGGMVHVYGHAAFQFSLPVCAVQPGSIKKSDSIKFIVFHPGHHRLVVVDSGNMLHAFALNHMTDSPTPNVSPPLPTREANYILFGEVRAVEQPLPSYTHMFITMKDGQSLAWDLRQKGMSQFNIPNLWSIHEERLVRSGVPGRHKTLGGPSATCSAMNPRDLNVMLIGYDHGVVAWNFQKGIIDKCFEMSLPPGAPGGGSYDDTSALWTERTPAVTCISWRPDGLVFAVGHVDGCISFWAYDDPDKPLLVRTLTHEDVNVTDAESLMEAGVLGGQPRSKKEFEGMPVLPASLANREPVFKLTWASFPSPAEMKALATQPEGSVPVTTATAEYSDRGETLLFVLGGQSEGEKPGINMLQFPAYQQPLPSKTKTNGSPLGDGLSLPVRAAFRDSLYPSGSSNYATRTPPEDFFLLPRNSPYFNMAHDPVTLFMLLTPDARLPKLDKSAERQLVAYTCPPPRSTAPPPVLSRKNYATPGAGENIIAMTPAPLRQTTSPVRTTPGSGWRFPWSASPTTTISNAPFSPISSVFAIGGAGRRKQRLPSQIWSGGMSVLGTSLISLPTPTFKRLIAWSIDNAGIDMAARVPLRGGLAVPDLQSHGAPDVKVIKMECYRLLVTWHADCTVRFWDMSPHVLVLPTPLRFEYPNPMSHLTINIGEWLRHPDIAHLPLAQLWATDRSKVQVASVQLSRETLECVVTFVTGEVLVTRFDEATMDSEDSHHGSVSVSQEDDEDRDMGYFPPQPRTDIDYIDEITEIDQLANHTVDGFKPLALFAVKRGEVVSCAVSDIGFIAVAFAQHSMAILDMRGPEVILREGFNEDGKTMKRRKRKGNVQNVPAENSLISSMKWVISGMGGDANPRPRLIVSYVKGTTKIYGITNVLGEWVVEERPPTFANDSLSHPLATFVLDPKTGDEMEASPDALADVIDGPQGPDGKWTKSAPPHCLWIAASKHAIRCAVNYNGERVAKVEFELEELSDVLYITRHGKRVVVALTTKGSAIFYTAPFLEYITRMDLFYGGDPRPIGKLSFDDRSGDFIEYTSPLDIALRTLFHFRKPFPPRLDPCYLKTPIPTQPTPLSAYALGWMWGAGPLSGSSLDSLIGGPHRPQAPKPPPTPRRPLITWGDPPKDKDSAPAPATPAVAPKRPAIKKQRAPRRDARERGDLYGELSRVTRQRNDYMDRLAEGMNNAAESTQAYLNSARDAMVKEGAKASARGVWAKVT